MEKNKSPRSAFDLDIKKRNFPLNAKVTRIHSLVQDFRNHNENVIDGTDTGGNKQTANDGEENVDDENMNDNEDDDDVKASNGDISGGGGGGGEGARGGEGGGGGEGGAHGGANNNGKNGEDEKEEKDISENKEEEEEEEEEEQQQQQQQQNEKIPEIDEPKDRIEIEKADHENRDDKNDATATVSYRVFHQHLMCLTDNKIVGMTQSLDSVTEELNNTVSEISSSVYLTSKDSFELDPEETYNSCSTTVINSRNGFSADSEYMSVDEYPSVLQEKGGNHVCVENAILSGDIVSRATTTNTNRQNILDTTNDKPSYSRKKCNHLGNVHTQSSEINAHKISRRLRNISIFPEIDISDTNFINDSKNWNYQIWNTYSIHDESSPSQKLIDKKCSSGQKLVKKRLAKSKSTSTCRRGHSERDRKQNGGVTTLTNHTGYMTSPKTVSKCQTCKSSLYIKGRQFTWTISDFEKRVRENSPGKARNKRLEKEKCVSTSNQSENIKPISNVGGNKSNWVGNNLRVLVTKKTNNGRLENTSSMDRGNNRAMACGRRNEQKREKNRFRSFIQAQTSCTDSLPSNVHNILTPKRVSFQLKCQTSNFPASSCYRSFCLKDIPKTHNKDLPNSLPLPQNDKKQNSMGRTLCPSIQDRERTQKLTEIGYGFQMECLYLSRSEANKNKNYSIRESLPPNPRKTSSSSNDKRRRRGSKTKTPSRGMKVSPR